MIAKAILVPAAFLAILAGWCQLFRFSATPGDQFTAPALLPGGDSSLDLRPGKSGLLLVFVHPQCSCTHATLQELDQLLSSTASPAANPVQVVLAVYDSPALRKVAASSGPFNPSPWLHHPYRILLDGNGDLARRFGAATSGEILLYSPDRHLLFQGGITPERAHVGDSLGAQSLRSALARASTQLHPQVAHASVFGCPIFHSGQAG